MSYTVTLTRNTIPEDDQKAWEYLDELYATETHEQSEDFLELIEKFKIKFPCICDLSDDEVDEGVWSDGPLSNNAGKNLTTLGIVFSAVEKTLPYLIKTANENHFAVFDGQEGIIFRPHKPKKIIWQDYTGAEKQKKATLYETLLIFDNINWEEDTYAHFPITERYLFQIMGQKDEQFLIEITDSENMIFHQKYVNRNECRKTMAQMFIKNQVEPKMFEGFEVAKPPSHIMDKIVPVILVLILLGLVAYMICDIAKYW